MEELNIKELLQYLLGKIWFIVLITILILGIGCTYSLFIQKPLYRSSTTIVLTHTSNEESTITQNDIVINQKLLSTYREIIKSRRILDKVAKNLKLDIDSLELSKTISVESVTDTELIKISVSNENKKEAVSIANEIARVFSKEISNIYKIENVSVIDSAVEPAGPYNMNKLKYIGIYTAIGLIFSIGIFFLAYYFDTRVKSEEELEKKLGLPILGAIPMRKEKKGRK